jgi:hypothetical protein
MAVKNATVFGAVTSVTKSVRCAMTFQKKPAASIIMVTK